MDIDNIKSGLEMQNLHFSDIRFQRNETISDGKVNIDVSKNVEKIAEHKYRVTVCAKLTQRDFVAIIEAKANFIYEGDLSQEEDIINTNTVAIIFPFIRSQMTLLTSQPNMQPVVLPTINTSKLK